MSEQLQIIYVKKRFVRALAEHMQAVVCEVEILYILQTRLTKRTRESAS